eukprot:362812-Chlamydomonas_euryale.AAC.2
MWCHHAVPTCGPPRQCTYAVQPCGATMQCNHAVPPCSAPMRCTHAGHPYSAWQQARCGDLIDLSGNSLGVETCTVLNEVLRENDRLDTLILRDNPIGHVGAKRLMRAVRMH